ncbi:MAG: trimethylamine methyltransferase family protein [Spirochaetota bacterium]|nr:MAG: trimethylamine methyltransferase family protein [Spirochaetota bacterium]
MHIDEFTLEGGLAKEQIDLIHEKALYLVEKIGIDIPHDGILKLLSDYSGVSIENENVKFKSDLVENALESAKYPLPKYAENNWIVSAGAHQTNLFDLNTGKIRQSTLKDLIDLIKLSDALDTVGSAPVVPLDQPYYLQEILMHKIAWEYSRYRANDMFEHDPKPTVEAATYIYDMAKTANKWFAVGLYMISPKTFDRQELEVVYRFLDRGVPMWAGTMPIAGVNAPITMQSALLQSMFETFSCLTMLSLINTKSINYIQVIDSFITHPFDWKYTTFVLGSAEDVRGTLNKISIHKYYNMPFSVKSLFTSGKEPDAHTAFEVGVHTLIAALAGARVFRCAGHLTSAEVYSAEMLVVVHEIIEYIKNILKTEEFNEERLMVDEIEAVGPGESYIGRQSAFDNFRKEYWEPELFIHSNLGQWKEMGSKSIRQYANEISQRKIAEHTYMMDKDTKKAIDEIYECAKNDEQLKRSYKV